MTAAVDDPDDPADWFKNLFDSYKDGDDYTLTATGKFRRDVESEIRDNPTIKENLKEELELYRHSNFWTRRKMKVKCVKYISEKDGKKRKMYQSRTIKCSKGTGRILFLFIDDEPDAPRPVIVFLSCQLTQKKEGTQSLWIKNTAKQSLPDFNSIEWKNVTEIPIPERFSVDGFTIEDDVRPWLSNQDIESIIKFCNTSNMSIRPTKEQLSTILTNEVPLFINGQAGTGKTVLLSLRLSTYLAKETVNLMNGIIPHRKKRLVTSMTERVVGILGTNTNEFIENFIVGKGSMGEDTFRYFKTQLQDEYQKEWLENESTLIFKSFTHILYDLLSLESKNNFDDPSEGARPNRVGYSRFSHQFFTPRKTKYQISSEMAWYGIRSLIKGNVGVNSGKLLTKEQFNKENTNDALQEVIDDLKSDFKDTHNLKMNTSELDDLFSCLDDYEAWKKEKKYYDDMDLALKAYYDMDLLIDNKFSFDEITLDEAQDLTDIEYRILLKLLRPEQIRNTILAGDPLQTINPTGFDWGRIRAMLWRTLKDMAGGVAQPVRDADSLSHNFRTPEEVIILGNKFLELRSHFKREVQNTQESHKKVRPSLEPCIWELDYIKSNQLNDLLKQHSSICFRVCYAVDNDGIKDIIVNDQLIEYDKQNRDELQLESITDVKGDEAEIVILYRVGDGITNEIRRILADPPHRTTLNKDELIQVSYALNKLYILITRTKEQLIIIESSNIAKSFWKEMFPNEEISTIQENELEAIVDSITKRMAMDFNPKEYAELMIERYYSTEDPKYLEWGLDGLEKSPTADRDYDWKLLKNQLSALLLDNQAAEEYDLTKKNELLLESAIRWDDFGDSNKAYQRRIQAKSWNEARKTECNQKNRDEAFLNILCDDYNENDIKNVARKLIDKQVANWIQKEEREKIENIVANHLLENDDYDTLCSLIESADSNMRDYLFKLADQFYKSRNDWVKYERLVNKLKKMGLGSDNSIIRGGMIWILKKQIALNNTVNLDRIKLRDRLIKLSTEEEQNDLYRVQTLDYLDLAFLKTTAPSDTNEYFKKANNSLNKMKNRTELLMETNKIILYLSNYDEVPKNRENPSIYAADKFKNLAKILTMEPGEFDKQRETLERFVSEDRFYALIIQKAKSHGSIINISTFNTDANLCGAYLEIYSDNMQSVYRRFKNEIENLSSNDAKILREEVINYWTDEIRRNKLQEEKEKLVNALCRGNLWPDLRDVSTKLGDKAVLDRIENEMILGNPKNYDIEALKGARRYFLQIGMEEKAKQISEKIPRDYINELIEVCTGDDVNSEKLLELLQGILDSDEEHKIVVKTIREYLVLPNNDDLDRAKFMIAYREANLPKQLFDALPELKEIKHELIDDWKLHIIKPQFDLYFNASENELHKYHFLSVKLRAAKMIQQLENLEKVGFQYNSVQEELEILDKKLSLKLAAWFSVLGALEEKPTKITIKDWIEAIGGEPPKTSEKKEKFVRGIISFSANKAGISNEVMNKYKDIIERLAKN